ncbi:hypothetical protein [Acidisarcina polymorpha]|uniref:hypothetical protein n=1 Tax=Acidisarcina polymorpha TaxID=2211140 RepID=UPI001F43408B|nr:hypothetical protein [Acidisarcina polymorpha]
MRPHSLLIGFVPVHSELETAFDAADTIFHEIVLIHYPERLLGSSGTAFVSASIAVQVQSSAPTHRFLFEGNVLCLHTNGAPNFIALQTVHLDVADGPIMESCGSRSNIHQELGDGVD